MHRGKISKEFEVKTEIAWLYLVTDTMIGGVLPVAWLLDMEAFSGWFQLSSNTSCVLMAAAYPFSESWSLLNCLGFGEGDQQR